MDKYFNYNPIKIDDYRFRRKILDTSVLRAGNRVININPLMVNYNLLIEKKSGRYMADRLGVLINILVYDSTLHRTGKGNLSRFFKLEYDKGNLIFKSARITMTVTLKPKLQKIVDELSLYVGDYKLSKFATMVYISDALLNTVPYDYPIVIANNDTKFAIVEYKNRNVLYAYNNTLNYPAKDLELSDMITDELNNLRTIGTIIDSDRSVPYFIKSKIMAIINYIGYYNIIGTCTIRMILNEILNMEVSIDLIENIMQYSKCYSTIVNTKNKYKKK